MRVHGVVLEKRENFTLMFFSSRLVISRFRWFPFLVLSNRALFHTLGGRLTADFRSD
jgi:hypothetical protein